MGFRGKDYERACLNNIFGKPTLEGIDKPLYSKTVKGLIVKPTFEVFKVDHFIHKAEYRKNERYKEASRMNEEYLGVHLLKFWYKWLEQLCNDRGCTMYQLVVDAGKPRLLQHLREKKYHVLAKLSYAYRFAIMLGEPFVPIYTEKELDEYEIPLTLYEKVKVVKTKRSLNPSQYGKFRATPSSLSWLRYKSNKRREKLRWRT